MHLFRNNNKLIINLSFKGTKTFSELKSTKSLASAK